MKSHGQEYLARLQASRRVDARAKKVSTLAEVPPYPSSKPIDEPIVAVNSSIEFIRKLEKTGYAKSIHDPILTGTSEGYAALCLFKPAKGDANGNY